MQVAISPHVIQLLASLVSRPGLTATPTCSHDTISTAPSAYGNRHGACDDVFLFELVQRTNPEQENKIKLKHVIDQGYSQGSKIW
ncbi:hypothetical protein HDV63DRAFT_386678 [Trichoderma sp. SZMC 28014]